MEELRLERERARKVRAANVGRLDEERVAGELRERAIPRRKWRAES
jgi:hypothetical protein